MTDDLRPVRRAIISVSDKTGLIEFGRALTEMGVQLISTGGTAAALRNAGLAVTEVAEVTGYPEMMEGRVRTLHPKIHGGLLALRDNPEHAQAMIDYHIEGIDLLVSNLYPFEATIAKGADFDTIIENIDVGGPAMTRAGAKNYPYVTVIVDTADYPRLLAELNENDGSTSMAFRKECSAKAFARTAAYDTAIANWYEAELAKGKHDRAPPSHRSFAGTLRQSLRYGENPHQRAAFYVTTDRRYGVASAEQVQGKELSYNNINDTDAAYELVAEFDAGAHAAVAIIKHANPCGVALAGDLKTAWANALACDPVSAFGGIVALNRTLDAETAEEIAKIFSEVIIAPDATKEARRVLASKKNLRLLIAGGLPDPESAGPYVKWVSGGFLYQDRDNERIALGDLKVVTKKQPSDAQIADLLFAFTIAKHVKSNAIVYAKDLSTAGIGAGQMSRVDSARIAARKAEDAAKSAGWSEPRTHGAAVASDAFFPFADGLLSAAAAGATSVIQPGGSIRDDEVIKAADDAGLAMVLTGVRHFRH